MKKIIVLMLTLVTLVTVQAQKKRIPGEQKEFRDKMLTEKLKL